MDLSEEQLQRYKRNIVIPGIGVAGQRKLLNAKVLIVGAGGLGSSCALYLAAAGIGTIGIVDFDSVELDNLQRQILHTTSDLGKLKAESAQEKLQGLNTDIQVIPYSCKVSSSNVAEIIDDYDALVECSDNFSTKYLLNDASVLMGKPFFYAAVLRFEGQAMTILPSKSSCYRCVFPQTPPISAAPSTQEAGILGAVAGTLGIIQATEVVKYFLGIGKLLTNTLLIFDALNVDFRKVKVQQNPACPACGVNPTIRNLYDS
ncbi:MAG: ThiF family adenylyltransferase [Candidatus Omnitrophota bacterium]|nr:MAG: ThiF family adenylyltransferase [Candidatus Omnitrophota bacterium]